MNRSAKAIVTAFWLVAVTAFVRQLLLFSLPVYAVGPWYVSPGDSDGNTCTNPATYRATISGGVQ
jgi:hypothetical protein